MGNVFANIGQNAIKGIGVATVGFLTAETGIGAVVCLYGLAMTGASIIALPIATIAYLFRKKQKIK